MSQWDRNGSFTYGSKTLEQVPIFEGLNEAERQQLTKIAHTMVFRPGEYVLREGELDQKLWIVIAGRCEVLHNGQRPGHTPVLLAVLERYENFGEMSFFHSAPHSASVRASSDVELICIERSDFDVLLDAGSQAARKVAINVIRSLASRLRRMDDWVTQLLADDVNSQRVAEWENFRNQLFNSWKF